MLKHSPDQYETTARAVLALNPHARGRFADAAGLARWMHDFAERHLDDGHPGYGGTFGFYITTYQFAGDPPGVFRTMSSVSPGLVLDHLGLP